eukprot:scaffold22688_cov55-Phaeocystis_antarctica.AAC.3
MQRPSSCSRKDLKPYANYSPLANFQHNIDEERARRGGQAAYGAHAVHDSTPQHLAQAAAAHRERDARERPCGLAPRAEAAESSPSPLGAGEASRCTAASRDCDCVGPEAARGEPRWRLRRRPALRHWPRPLGGAPPDLHRQALVRLRPVHMQCTRRVHAVYAQCACSVRAVRDAIIPSAGGCPSTRGSTGAWATGSARCARLVKRPPLGRTRARPLRLLRAPLAALGAPGDSWRHNPPMRRGRTAGRVVTASMVADPSASVHPGARWRAGLRCQRRAQRRPILHVHGGGRGHLHHGHRPERHRRGARVVTRARRRPHGEQRAPRHRGHPRER